MWPVSIEELARTIGYAHPLKRAIAAALLHRAIAWPGSRAASTDVLFVVDRSMRDEVADALTRGATCVVDRVTAIAHDRCLVVDRPLVAFRRFAAFMRSRFSFPVIAVGGSNGKTTTKDMIAAVLADGDRHVTSTPGTNNGWIGVPITLCRPEHRMPAPDALVVEIGIDACGAMRDHVAIARPDVSVITALGAEHLAGLGSHERAVREELMLMDVPTRVWLADEPALAARLAVDVRPADIVVHHAARTPHVRCERLAYSWSSRGVEGGDLAISFRDKETRVRLATAGAHNARNAALALGVAALLGRPPHEVAGALSAFRAPDQRCTVRRLPSGCLVIDDTYNASPASMGAAFDLLDELDPHRVRFVILGDMLDLGSHASSSHEALVPRLDGLGPAHVRLYGEAMHAIAPLIENALSIGRARADESPTVLVDVHELDDAAVLVKGSRGMQLERVVTFVEALSTDRRDPTRVAVGVAGADSDALAHELRARVGCRAVVRALTLAELEAGHAARSPFDVGIVTAFEPKSDDLERELAAIAQLLVHLRASGGAVVPSSEAGDLLMSILPSHARVERAAREEILDTAMRMIAFAHDAIHRRRGAWFR